MGGGAKAGGDDGVRSIGDIKLLARAVSGIDIKDLRSLADEGKKQVGSGVVAIVGVTDDGKAGIVVGVTADLTARFNAVDLVRKGAEALGGKGGGGRPDMAQAGGPDGSKADAALKAIEAALGLAVQRIIRSAKRQSEVIRRSRSFACSNGLGAAEERTARSESGRAVRQFRSLEADLRHRLLQVLVDLVEEARGREPLLVGADQQREVLGHVAGLDGVDADLLQRARRTSPARRCCRAWRGARGPRVQAKIEATELVEVSWPFWCWR